MENIEIKEVVKQTKVKAHTLRYYENIGLIKNIRRDNSGKRIYSKKDISWIEFLKRLKNTGMKISEMQKYSELRNQGDITITERKNILMIHSKFIINEIEKLTETQKYVNEKIEIYKKMEADISGNRE